MTEGPISLTPLEARVLGSLMEKEVTTPDQYPLSLNALIASCNQKSSRDPVLEMSEIEVRRALSELEDKNLVRTDHGGRVERYENLARTAFHLRRDEHAVLCLLLLRGAQTPGELRGRAERLFNFEDVPAVLSVLHRLAGSKENRQPLAAALERIPGSREVRYVQLLTPVQDGSIHSARQGMAPSAQSVPADELTTLRGRIDRLEERLSKLEQVLAAAGTSSEQ